MRVLVTGGAGFIGQHVVRALLDRGHQVRVLDLLRPDAHDGRARALGTELFVGDVLEADLLGRTLAGIEAVVHLAGVSGLS